MQHKVIQKQENATDCFVCGTENPLGLKAFFYELENQELAAVFQPQEGHQSYPERLHGGMAAAILDETIGRAIMILEPGMWGVTMELSLRYRRPVPLNVPLKVVGRITKNTHRVFEGTGELLLPDGSVAVTAQGRYLKQPLERITEQAEQKEEMMHLVEDPADPVEIEY